MDRCAVYTVHCMTKQCSNCLTRAYGLWTLVYEYVFPMSAVGCHVCAPPCVTPPPPSYPPVTPTAQGRADHGQDGLSSAARVLAAADRVAARHVHHHAPLQIRRRRHPHGDAGPHARVSIPSQTLPPVASAVNNKSLSAVTTTQGSIVTNVCNVQSVCISMVFRH